MKNCLNCNNCSEGTCAFEEQQLSKRLYERDIEAMFGFNIDERVDEGEEIYAVW